jgi:hypothetical protein
MLQFIKTNKNYIFAFFAGFVLAMFVYCSKMEPFIVNMGSDAPSDMVLNETDLATLIKIAFNVNTTLTKKNLSQILEAYKRASLSQGSYNNLPLDTIEKIYPENMSYYDKKAISYVYTNKNTFKKMIDKIISKLSDDDSSTVESHIKKMLFKKRKTPIELKELARLIGYMSKYYPNLINDITSYWEHASSLSGTKIFDDTGADDADDADDTDDTGADDADADDADDTDDTDDAGADDAGADDADDTDDTGA